MGTRYCDCCNRLVSWRLAVECVGGERCRQRQRDYFQTDCFGAIASSGKRSTITLGTDGTLTSSDPNYVFEGGESPGTFQITGDPNALISISITNVTALSPTTGNAPNITFTNLQNNGGATPTIGTDGTTTLMVGGDITVRANQPLGSYAGSYTLTVNYQ